MKIAVVANPASGRGRGVRYGQRAAQRLAELGHDVTYMQGVSAEESQMLLKQAHSECDVLVAAGGDGLVHMALQVVATGDVPLAIVPAGTGNDAARSLGIPLRDPISAVELIDQGALRTIDLGKTTSPHGERWFMQILSTGFDSIVNERANGYRWPKGRMKYNLAMLATLPRFRSITYQLDIGQGRESIAAMLVAIANGPSYGGGMLVCPDARFDDGLADVMVLEPVGVPRFLALFPRVYRGTHIWHPKVRTARGERIEIDGAAVAYADGERIGPLPVTVQIVPGALKVFAPAVG